MFYFHEWLSRRCNGRFSVLWLAATHPRKLRPRDFLMVDVARACDDVTKVVLVREREDLPARQRPRFSLYLSSQLAYGIVVIHRRQVDIFLGELSSYFLTVDISEKKVQKAVKGRKRKDEEEPGRGKRAVPEGRTEPGALVLAHTVQDVASITLREEVVRAPEPDEVFGEDLGPIPPAFFEGGNLMEMIIAMEAREQGEQAVPAVMETMLASVHEPSTSDTTGVTLPTMGQDVSRPPEMQESAPLVQLPEESQQTTKASVGLPPKASVAVSPTPPRPPAEPMEVSEQPGPPAGLVELVTPEPTEATVQPEQPPAGDVPQPVPATEERQALQILPRAGLWQDSSELQLPEAAQPPRRRRRRHGPVLVDRELRVPVEAMQASIQHYQDTMRAQLAREDVARVRARGERGLEELFREMGTRPARATHRALTLLFQRSLQSEMETTFDLRARLLHISEEQQRDEERETESSASGSSASTPADRLRQRLSRTAPSIRLETPDQPQVPFELEVLAEEMVATPRRIQTVPEAHPLADDEVRGLLAEEREPPAREGEQAGVGVARTPEPPQPSPPRHARLSDVTPESVLAALLPLWAAGDGTTFRQLCPPASTVRVRAAKTFATLLNLSAKKQLWLEQENGRHYGEIFIHQTTARSQA